MKRILTFLFLILLPFALQGQRVLTYNGKVLRAYDANQPLNIDDPCAFWFDGWDAGSFTLDGTSVDQWDDKSGNDRHVLNTNNNATRPTYDSNTGRVTFINANSTFLQSAAFGPLTQPNTLFFVFKSNSPAEFQYIFNGNSNNHIYYIGNKWKIRATTILVDGTTDNNTNIHCIEYNGVNTNWWINGVSVVSGDVGTSSLTGIILGTYSAFSNYADAEICELIVYNASISATDRDIITAYLADKWSITSTTTHKGYILRY